MTENTTSPQEQAEAVLGRKLGETVLTPTFYPGSPLHHGGWDPAGDGGPDCPHCHHEITSGPVCTRDECPGDTGDVSVTSRILLAHELPNYDPALIPTCWWCNGRLDLVDEQPVCVNQKCHVAGVTGLDWDEEPEGCSYMVERGSKDPDSGHFGPDEYCENYRLPDGDQCGPHVDAGDRW